MKRKAWIALIILLAVALLTFSIGSAAPSVFSLPWFTVDGGGGRIAGDNYTLEGVIGQPDASTLSGGVYTLSGGFLQPGGETEYTIFLPLVTR